MVTTTVPPAEETLGFGVGLARTRVDELLRSPRSVDWLEIEPERWSLADERTVALLDACAERWPVVPHSRSLSLGGPDPLDDALIETLATMTTRLRAPYLGDHLAFSRVGGAYLHALVPLPFTLEAAEHIARRATEASARIGAPLVLGNVTYHEAMPGSALTESELVAAVLERCACDLLFDVTAACINALNHGLDPRTSVDHFPLQRIRQLSLSGMSREGGRVVARRASPVPDEVWELYAHLLARLGRPVSTVVEWYASAGSLDRALDEVDRARSLARWALGARAEGAA